MIDEDELIEYAIVYGDYKGIPKQQVRDALSSGKDVIMRIDVQGAETVRKLAPEAVLIFITVDSEDELLNRLRERKTETADSLKLQAAARRNCSASRYGYVVLTAISILMIQWIPSARSSGRTSPRQSAWYL
jgi:guanylate kinase